MTTALDSHNQLAILTPPTVSKAAGDYNQNYQAYACLLPAPGLLAPTRGGFFYAPAAGLGPQSEASLVAAERLDGGRRKTTHLTMVTGGRDDGGRLPGPFRLSPSSGGGLGVAWFGAAKQQQQNAAEGQKSNLPELPDSSSTQRKGKHEQIHQTQNSKRR